MRGLLLGIQISVVLLLGAALTSAQQPPDAGRPYVWPQALAKLEDGRRVRFRDTRFECQYDLWDRSAWLTVFYDGQMILEADFAQLRQFVLLDTPTAWPVFQAWGERIDDQNTRLLIGPLFSDVGGKRDGQFLCYFWRYVERYVQDRSTAHDDTAFDIINAAGQKRSVHYAGLEEFSSPGDADRALKDAQRPIDIAHLEPHLEPHPRRYPPLYPPPPSWLSPAQNKSR